MSVGFYERSSNALLDSVNSMIRARSHRLVRWNLAPFYPGMRSARVFVVSAPKCGRTWLRVLLAAYSAHSRSAEPSRHIEANERRLGIMFVHDRWEHSVAPWTTLVFGRCLVPARARQSARIVLLVRDPRDAVVSLYFQLSRRDAWFSGTMTDMLRDPLLGIRALVDTMNGWALEWKGSDRVMLLRYEDLIADPERGFSRFLDFSLGSVDDEPLRRAIEFSSFASMKKLEAEGYFHDALMRPRLGDAEALKVRRGKVGGFSEYLSDTDLTLANREVARLDPWFGYDALGERASSVANAVRKTNSNA